MHGIVCCFVRLSFCHCVIAVITIFEPSHSYNLRQKMAAISDSISADFSIISWYYSVIFCHAVLSGQCKFIAYVFNGSIILECPSRAVVCKSGSLEWLSVKITA